MKLNENQLKEIDEKGYHTGRKESYEKIIIKKEDTTNQNVK